MVVSAQRERLADFNIGINGAKRPSFSDDYENDVSESLMLCADAVKENLHEELYTQV
jgi:hypothetical protein